MVQYLLTVIERNQEIDMKTRDKILETATKLVVEKGFDKVSLTEIANAVGISQPALYKHFKNKNEVFETLSLAWLDEMLKDIFPFVVKSDQTQAEIIHDWLWTMAKAKFDSYQNEREMFILHTNYVGGNLPLAQKHVQDLIDSLSEASGITDKFQVENLIFLFAIFHNPYFAPMWENSRFQERFENSWKQVEPFYQEKKR